MTVLRMIYQSVLAEWLTTFTKGKFALGRRFAHPARALRLFDRYLVAQGITSIDAISSDVITAFLLSRPRLSARSYNELLGVIRRFFQWMVDQQILSVSPVQVTTRREGPRRRPFLFGVPEARRLLELARDLPDRNRAPQRGPTYHAIFAILYGLGLRVGEVAKLCLGDLDLERQILTIRETKFGKSRLVPFGPRLARVLRNYIEHHRYPDLAAADTPLFTFDGRQSVSTNSIRKTFRDYLIPRLGLAVPPGTGSPRVHDLRHSFAVGALLRWYRDGLNPAVRLPHLSTFLGHINTEATAVYLTITDDLLQEASHRFSRCVPPLMMEAAE